MTLFLAGHKHYHDLPRIRAPVKIAVAQNHTLDVTDLENSFGPDQDVEEELEGVEEEEDYEEEEYEEQEYEEHEDEEEEKEGNEEEDIKIEGTTIHIYKLV